MILAKHIVPLALLGSLLGKGTLGCTRASPPTSLGTATLPNARAPSNSRATEPPATPTEVPVDACEYLRQARGSCTNDSPNQDYFELQTTASLAQCSALSLLLSTGPLEEALNCIRNHKSTTKVVPWEPSYCTHNPVEECVIRVLEARSKVIPSSDDECSEMALACGSQPLKGNTHVCRVLDAAIAHPFRKSMRGCLSWQCDNRHCVGELLALGRKAQSHLPLTHSNSPCTDKSGLPKVVTSEALEAYGECPPMYSSIHIFLWYLDAPPAPEFVDECTKLVDNCNVRRLKTRRTDVPMNLTQRPCRTALWATKPQFRKELSKCMSVGCNAADCLSNLATRFAKSTGSPTVSPSKHGSKHD
jgi:hypothetical protein